MIDRKTRDKIVKLKREGYSRTEIKTKTKVSLPTIRRILLEEGEITPVSTRRSASQNDPDESDIKKRLSTLEDEVRHLREVEDAGGYRLTHRFPINFTRNYPEGRCQDVWEMLSRGVAPWRYKEHLLKLFNPLRVSQIEKKINEYDIHDKIFEIEIYSSSTNLDYVNVKPIYDSFE